MCTTVPTFDAMPQLMVSILNKLEALERKFDALNPTCPEEEDVWFSLKELCEYLPTHPAEQTVYGWTSSRSIPFHKKGKNIYFLKSEIDTWLMEDARRSTADIMDEARAYVASNPKNGKEVHNYHG